MELCQRKGGGKGWLKISMLESLGSARLNFNSGWNGDLPGKGLFLSCQHRKAKSESREPTNSSLGSSIHFDSFFFLARFLCLAQNFVFILAPMTYFLGIFRRVF